MTLLEVRADSAPESFPRSVLSARTAFDFFGAGFLGKNSAVHLERAGMRVSVVDTDDKRLEEMAGLYPRSWKFIRGDAFEIARLLREGRHQADLVVVDPWTQHVPRVLEALPLFAALARSWLVFGLTAEQGNPPDLAALLARVDAPLRPVELVKRSDHIGGVWWGVAGIV